MTHPTHRLTAMATLFLFAVLMPVAAGADGHEETGWNQYRGPQAVGKAVSGTLPDGEYGLTTAWATDLGSGYSGLSIADSSVVAMFTSGDDDVVAAYDLETGEERWRHVLGEKYAGHDGSTDGPLSTPAISGGTVYAMSATGKVVALDLADGSEKWTYGLDEENSTTPFYGYTSSPLVVDGHVIVASGGEGHAVTAFEAESGDIVWSTGDGTITYQSPTLLELGGGRLLMTVTDQKLLAIDPTDGAVEWELQHTEGNRNEQSAHAVAIDDDRFLVGYNNGAKLYRLTDGGAEVVWESRAFGNTWAIPVRVGDHLYGFTGRFLTCADLETGEIVWRSRPPGGLGLTVVDDTLVILDPDGELVLVAASPEGYQEIARVPALDNGDHAVPSYADGIFVVRNLGQIAAVEVDADAEPMVAEMDRADRLHGAFGEWVAKVEAMPEEERQAAVDAYFEEIEQTPIVEPSGWTHFVWRGEAEDIGLQGDFWPNGEQEGLHQVAGTDLYFHSVELDPKAQYTYYLVPDFGQGVQDPMNPNSVDNGFAVASELRMPEWPPSPHLEPVGEGEGGELDTFPFYSEVLDNRRTIQVWRPAGYGGDPETRYPVLVVNHGDNLLRGGLMRHTLDNLVGNSVEPLIAVFVPRTTAAEYGGDQVDDYMRFLAEELLPFVDRHYLTDGERRAIMGPGSAGVAAIYAAVHHPDLFQRAAAQSYYTIEPAHTRIPEAVAADGEKPDHIFMVWSNHDYSFNPEGMPEKVAPVLADQLEAAGIGVTREIANYSPGWGGWRGQHDEILVALFPAMEEEG